MSSNLKLNNKEVIKMMVKAKKKNQPSLKPIPEFIRRLCQAPTKYEITLSKSWHYLALSAVVTSTLMVSMPSLVLAMTIGDTIYDNDGINIIIEKKGDDDLYYFGNNGSDQYSIIDLSKFSKTFSLPEVDQNGDFTGEQLGYSVVGYFIEGGEFVALTVNPSEKISLVDGYYKDSDGNKVIELAYRSIDFVMPEDPNTAPEPEKFSLITRLTFASNDDDNWSAPTAGYTLTRIGANGKGGSNGALFVSPTQGEKGHDGNKITNSDLNQSSYQNITTSSDNAPGVFIASIGGRGGNGGSGYLGPAGKSGGNAGNGGDVDVSLSSIQPNTTNISTTGQSSHGVVVQSRAGVAGNGGRGFVAVGAGSGGAAGSAGSVKLTNGLNIITTGQSAHGLLVQSLGGGGGNGGSDYGLFVSIPGDPGSPGHAGKVEVIHYGAIETNGDNAYGILAQSIGGNGGDAGAGGAMLVMLGADGSAGGNSGQVYVSTGNNSSITTKGKNAYGIYAQSVGGGGGSATSGGALVGIGSTAGIGGSANFVSVKHAGLISTEGAGSYGVFAQSIGGGGGSGGTLGGLVSIGATNSGDSNKTGLDAGSVSITILSSSRIYTQSQGARAVVAQSIGGGGGDAGSSSSALLSIGGKGLNGGKGGDVSVLAQGVISTQGDGADGIYAQSIGGGGGSGASGVGLIALGGQGGKGGHSGKVEVKNDGSLITSGLAARGIVAQSIGGGGGDAGVAGGLIAIGSSGGKAGDANIGGDGDTAGGDNNGDAVTVFNTGYILTSGAYAHAIQAQSIGGGGGDGGVSVGVLSIGGKGNAGGKSGDVIVTNEKNITTQGSGAHGIFGQAIGGGGGAGGVAISSGFMGSVAVGGSGGGGGAGGNVKIQFQTNPPANESDILPSIITQGDRSRGVFAQSIGGGGGSGGDSISSSASIGLNLNLALGGQGEKGGAGGDVSVSGYSNISTIGRQSDGLLLQSIGGGGGEGGFAISSGLSISSFANMNIAIGGKGGAGGQGGKVSFSNGGGQISTSEDDSSGLVAQSIGGGGGVGGLSVSTAITAASPATLSMSLGIGGSGGSGGKGNEVDINYMGSIQTSGNNSYGVLTQSIGGGGGYGGFNISTDATLVSGISAKSAIGIGGSGGKGGNGALVKTHIDGSVITRGFQSTGVVAQSIGGGGGSGGFSVSSILGFSLVDAGLAFGLGGTGGSGGEGGRVELSVGGLVTTEKDYSTGVIAQSVGGGGGAGGFAVAGAVSIGGASGAASVGLGGKAGDGAKGGSVLVRTHSISTLGAHSPGVLAQSIGGGGGAGGFSVASSLSGGASFAGALNIGLGGSAGKGGDAGAVELNSSGMSITQGEFSAAVIAQSIGGGGGSGGFSISGGVAGGGAGAGALGVSIGGDGGSGGAGNSVTLTAKSDLAVLSSSSAIVTSTETSNNIERLVAYTQGDDSIGVLAQSIGGGGGSGGFSISGGIAAGGVGAGVVNVGLGGHGDGGGVGGTVDMSILGDVWTLGDRSNGILAQSIGGGGGAGGFSVGAGIAGAVGGSGAINVGLGGSAGLGSQADKVTVDLTGSSMTLGEFSSAVVAQSIGGGGGAGGFSIAGGVTGAGAGSGAVSLALGGSGGGGGQGGQVSLTLKQSEGSDFVAYTHADHAMGVVAQSIGGGGGAGGFSVPVSLSVGGIGGGNVNIGLGGSGGDGGSSNTVDTTIVGNVFTEGNYSTGVIAQSIGGGGGAGGFNVAAGIAGGGTGAGAINLGFGGSGGKGSNADAVNLKFTGSSITLGEFSSALVAQSIGGGGGSGGFSVAGGMTGAGTGSGALTLSLGGSGGGGGNAGQVNLTVNASLDSAIVAYTSSNDSAGIVAQSIGGGGGAGGFNVAGNVTGAGTGSGAITVGLGGSGGSGGKANQVNSTVSGDIYTLGDRSVGLLAQSIGGGGGSGGFNVTGSISLGGKGAGNVNVGLGGRAGSGSHGDTVDLTFVGTSVTYGEFSSALVAQSIGGGGGSGGFSVGGSVTAAGTGAGTLNISLGGSGGSGGAGGKVNLKVNSSNTDHSWVAYTEKNNSLGIVAQSIGGGGGGGGFNVSGTISAAGSGSGALTVGLGGSGGLGGAADEVKANIRGDILTKGDGSNALIAQSIGGGGGSGGFNVSGSIAFGKRSGQVGVGIGGFGGDGGNSSRVMLNYEGNVWTQGEGASGLTAQSIGGGGGAGGMNITGSLTASTSGSGSLGFGLGGFGGAGGSAGQVTATILGNVSTEKNDSYGALLQSLGGGGGSGGLNVTQSIDINAGDSIAGSVGLGIGGFGGKAGDGDEVLAQLTGDYGTSGDRSQAIVAQSIGGGGGTGGISVASSVALSAGKTGVLTLGIGGFGKEGGRAGDVSLSVDGNVATQGLLSDAVVAQSIGGGGGAGGINVSGSISASLKDDSYGLNVGVGGFGGQGGASGKVSLSIKSDQLITKKNSNAVVAQSIGGGGGGGGLNVSGDFAIANPSASTSRVLNLGIGGFGGKGGDADQVSLVIESKKTDNQRLLINVQGDDASGVIAQSIGGGGGAGGINVAGSLSMGGSATLGIGGFGGNGGKAGDVFSTIDANITVDELDLTSIFKRVTSHGLLIQSIGGGGGAGGINISAGIQAKSNTKEPSIVFGVGGFAGDGSASGNVTATHTGDITLNTKGTAATIQSIGGGGGTGGLNATANLDLGENESGAANPNSFAIAGGIGGFGGKAGNAGDVLFRSDGHIFSNGAGILAQSIGGGGGQGGMNVVGLVAVKGAPIALGIGGSGGSGGNAGKVSVLRGQSHLDNNSDLTSLIANAGHGITAQSIGGGGGQGGYNFVFELTKHSDPEGEDLPKQSTGNDVSAMIVVGGSGAAGGNGDMTNVNNYGHIKTKGDNHSGIFAQSVGGGGGNAGFSFGGGYQKGTSSLNLAVGGQTGNGGNGANVTVTHDGNVETVGLASYGIVAQSIGGGGGNTQTTMALGFGGTNSIGVSIGRLGGEGGKAGDVTISSVGDISTKLADSIGIFAQSIGGGGGASSTTSVSGSIKNNEGDETKLALSIGLNGGKAATSGNVIVDFYGTIVTNGERSQGILAQAIGGGGGKGGMTTSTALSPSNLISLSLGGAGGEGAKSGMVTINGLGSIYTEGNYADGILAQSIGGGGGAGGSTYTGVMVGAEKETLSATVALGGTGGKGGEANRVSVTNSGQIITDGIQSFGIRAQSIGGGGGVGGAMYSATIETKGVNNRFDLNVGGDGGVGGSAGEVSIENKGSIITLNQQAAGIVANSIGGGGGDAGIMVNFVTGRTADANQEMRLGLNLGGMGGQGGKGGDVKVVQAAYTKTDNNLTNGAIITLGDYSYGILAQSLGGGGGNGSSVVSVQEVYSQTPVDKKNPLLNLTLNLGGVGGTGGKGGAVDVSNAGLIKTSGKSAHGILAQSIGGGGGNGGFVVSGSFNIGPVVGGKHISIGGSGGSGNDGGGVTVTNTGSIVTTGDDAHGILAQSIGGGGGNANLGVPLTNDPISLGVSTLTALLGGTGVTGGTGGSGGQVTVNHSGNISVTGKRSVAIKAESINGGGGSLGIDISGFNIPGLMALPGDLKDYYLSVKDRLINGKSIYHPNNPNQPQTDAPTGLLAINIGAQKSSGMNAGKVTINDSGTYISQGLMSTASLMQGISGGGGTTSTEFDESVTSDNVGGNNMDIAISLGGSNGVSNLGSDVSASHSGELRSIGQLSSGQLTQSIGGGGGLYLGSFKASQLGSAGLVYLNFGAEKSKNEQGGAIEHIQSGLIQTTGIYSHGVILQSIGGGGGSALVMSSSGDSKLRQSALDFGAFSGTSAHGQNIHATFDGGIQTLSDDSIGLLVQSIGGGGGEARLLGLDISHISMGGQGDTSGNGGNVSLHNTGDVFTSGFDAHGLLLQSIGGGGGTVLGHTSETVLTLNTENVGNGGNITFEQSGAIITLGDRAYGVIAQSIGGGGGWINNLLAGTAGGVGQGGYIKLRSSDTIASTGQDATAVFVQSVGESGGRDISLDLGLTRGGSGQGMGVFMDGGANNTLVINNALSSVSGIAVRSTSGNDQVTNHGQLYGHVYLGAGNNRLYNSAEASYMTFGDIQLREPSQMAARAFEATPAPYAFTDASVSSAIEMTQASPSEHMVTIKTPNTFVNEGTLALGLDGPNWNAEGIEQITGRSVPNATHLMRSLDPKSNLLYGAQVITQATIDGNFLQTKTGNMIFDVVYGPYPSDHIHVTGDVVLDGQATINLLWLENTDPISLISVDGRLFNKGLSILPETLAMKYQISDDASGLKMGIRADFTKSYLRPNERRIAEHMNSALAVGGAVDIPRLFASIGNLVEGQEGKYKQIFTELNPEGHIAALHTQYQGALNFNQQLFQCDWSTVNGDNCLWSSLNTKNIDELGSADYFATSSRLVSGRMGVEHRLPSGWIVSGAAGLNRLHHQTVDQGNFSAQSNSIDIGGGGRYLRDDGVDLQIKGAMGWQWIDSSRTLSVFEPTLATASGQSGYGQISVETGYTSQIHGVALRPALAITGTAIRVGSYQESGLGGMGMRIGSGTQFIANLEPKVSLRYGFSTFQGYQGGVGLNFGFNYRSSHSLQAPMRFIGASSSVKSAMISTPLDKNMSTIGVSVDLSNDKNWRLEFNYEGQFGDRMDVHSGNLNIQKRF